MPDTADSRDAELDEATLQLSDGLKNCRKVVERYRTALSESAEPAAPVEQLATQKTPSTGPASGQGAAVTTKS